MYVRELTNFFTQEATVSSCQPTRLKLWAESFGQQPVWWVTNIQSILDCNFTPFQYISLIHDWNSLSNLSSLPKKQPATTWDPIQLLQRTLHPIMNSKTKILYDNTTDKSLLLIKGNSGEEINKKKCAKSDHIEQILIIPSWNKTIRRNWKEIETKKR